MSWAASSRKGFFLAEAAVACLVAAIFLSASFSALFVSGALARRAEQSIKRERLLRESLTGYAPAIQPPAADPYGYGAAKARPAGK